MRPTGGAPGALQSLNSCAFSIAANGIGLRRAPEPNQGEGACGWSGALQRRVTPSPTDTKYI